jgi:hypothetical protein
VIVAVVTVRVVQVAADEVVDVVTVRHGLVSAFGSVRVLVVVVGAVVVGGAISGVAVADRDCVALDGAAVVIVKLAVVQIVDVVLVAYGRVTAVGAVLVFVVVAHVSPSPDDAHLVAGVIQSPPAVLGGDDDVLDPNAEPVG